MAREDAAGDDLDDLDDLDDPDDPDDADDADDPASVRARPGTVDGRTTAGLARWPAQVPAWARGPAAVVVLVVVSASLGALAGSAHREARDERTSLEQALTVGQAFLADQALQSGQLRAEVSLALANHGDQTVTVRLQGLTTPHQGTLEPPEEVQLTAGGVVAAPLEVAVDCSAFRGADAAAVPTAVLATVRGQAGAEGAVDVRLPVLQSTSRALDEEIAASCGGPPLHEPQTGWLWKDDGALRVTVAVPALGSPERLVLEGSEGLGATADPPLPRSLSPGETAVLDLRVDPDCAVVGDGSLSWLDLQARDPQGGSTPLGRSSGTSDPVSGVQPWLARQVALACG